MASFGPRDGRDEHSQGVELGHELRTAVASSEIMAGTEVTVGPLYTTPSISPDRQNVDYDPLVTVTQKYRIFAEDRQ